MHNLLPGVLVAVFAVFCGAASASDQAWIEDTQLDGPGLQTAILDAHHLGRAPLDHQARPVGPAIRPLEIAPPTASHAVVPVARNSRHRVLKPILVLPAALVVFGALAALGMSLVRRSS